MPAPPNIALYGGSFNPIHLGHVSLLELVLATFQFDQCHLIPCKKSPHKTAEKHFSNKARLEMCKLAVHHLSTVTVNPIELDRREEPSYSWVTVEFFRQAYPDHTLYWILGADQWNVLHTWSRYDYLVQNLTFIIIQRQEPLLARPQTKSHILNFNNLTSSSQIRDDLMRGLSPSGLPASVLRYINYNSQ